MKPSVSNAMHVINRASAEIIEQIECLRNEGVLTPHLAEISVLAFKQRCADVIVSAVHRIAASEIEEAAGYQRDLLEKEKKLSEQK